MDSNTQHRRSESFRTQAWCFKTRQQWLLFHASPTVPSLPSSTISSLHLTFLPQTWPHGFWAQKEVLGGSASPLELAPPTAPKPRAGSGLARTVLMPKVLAFMAARPVMTLTEMMWNRLVIEAVRLFQLLQLCDASAYGDAVEFHCCLCYEITLREG